MSTSDDTSPDGRVGFRDIYRAVGESETRIVAALNAAILPLSTSANDHEARLRSIEAAVAPLAVLASDRDRRLTLVEKKAETTERLVNDSTERRAGVWTTLGAGKTFFLLLSSILSPIIAVLALITK